MIATLSQTLNAAFKFAGHLHWYKHFVLRTAEEFHHSRVCFSSLSPFTEYVRIDEIHA
jgi:hypothetical protein